MRSRDESFIKAIHIKTFCKIAVSDSFAKTVLFVFDII